MSDPDDDDVRQDDDDPNPEMWPDVEWSSEQSFHGEFGSVNQFGDRIE